MFAFSPRDLLPPPGTHVWTGGFARPAVLSFSFATAGIALTEAEQGLLRDALSAWQAVAAVTFVETPWRHADLVLGFGAPGDSVVLPAAPTLRDALKATGAALGLAPDLPGASLAATVMAAEPGPALAPGWADAEALTLLFGDPAEAAGVRWRYDPALDRLRGDLFAFEGRTLFGGTAGTALFGDIGDDLLFGGPGDDIFMGGPGHNAFHGGPGRDVVVSTFLRAEASFDFRFQRMSTEWGTDQWDGIEFLRLRDGGFALHSHEPAALVERLYQALLLRAADPTGLTTWTAFLEAGGSGEELIRRIIWSEEYLERFGPPDATVMARGIATLAPVPAALLETPIWVPDAAAVLAVRFHLLALGAAPDRARFDHWQAVLEGAPDHAGAAQAFLDAHPGHGFPHGQALLDAAWSLPVIRATAPWVDAGVALAPEWLL